MRKLGLHTIPHNAERDLVLLHKLWPMIDFKVLWDCSLDNYTHFASGLIIRHFYHGWQAVEYVQKGESPTWFHTTTRGYLSDKANYAFFLRVCVVLSLYLPDILPSGCYLL